MRPDITMRRSAGPLPFEFPLRDWPSPRLQPSWSAKLDGLTRCHALIYSFGAAWYGGAEGIVRVDPIGSQRWVTGTAANVIEMFAMGDSLYAAYNQTPLRIDRIDPMSLKAEPFVIEDPSQGRLTSFGKGSICSDGNFIYACTQQQNSVLLVYDLRGKFVTSIPLYDGQWLHQAHNCKTDGDAVYVTSAAQEFSESAAICKVDMELEKVVASTRLPGGILTDDLGMTAASLWVAQETTSNLYEIRKSDLVYSPIVTGMPSVCFLMKSDGRFVWAGFTGIRGLVRIDPFSRKQDLFTLPVGFEGSNEMAVDRETKTAFFSCWQPEGGLGGTDPTMAFAVALDQMQAA